MKIAEILPAGNHVGTVDAVNDSGDVVPIDPVYEIEFPEFLGATATSEVLKLDKILGEAPASTSPDELATQIELVDPEARATRRAEELLAMRDTRPDLEEEPSDDNRRMYGQ